MNEILHNLRLNFGRQIRVLLIPVLFAMFTNFASAQTTAIPDANFEQALITLGIDTDGVVNAAVLTADISVVTSLGISGQNISNLTGIEAFSSLQTLTCQNNPITGSLNLSMLTNLTSISFLNNQLSSINVTGLTNLTYLELWLNQLTSIDLSTNVNLTYLDCDQNQFTSLDVSLLTGLQTFYCNTNLLTSIDVRGLTSLATNGVGIFQCSVNPRLSCILIDTVAPATQWLKDPTATYCTLTTYSGGAWSPATPTANNSAVIEANYNVAADITACSLIIKNNATVTIPSGNDVNLNGALTVTAGSTFTLSNNANLVQTNINSTNSGAINVNRNSNDLFRLDYTLWSSPVTGTQTLANFSPLTSTNRFYTYSPSANQYNLVSSAIPFAPGTGYLIRMPNEDPSNLGLVSPYYLGASPLTYNGVFTGTPNNGGVSVIGLASDTYNAVGNPYPSTIGAQLFLDVNDTNGILYFWRKKNADLGSSYATFSNGGGTSSTPTSAAPDGTIGVGQGFIVKTGVAATQLNFTNLMRTTNNSAQFFKTKKLVEKSRVWLNLTNTSGVFSQALVSYVDGATLGFDKGIDGKYINDSPIALTSNINNEEYTIQGRPAFDPSDVVGLNFKTNVAGDYTIAIDHVDGLFATSQDIYLLDSKTGTETNLKVGGYNFTAAAGVDNSRFSLKYQKTLKVDSSMLNDNSVQVYKNKGTLYVNAGEKAIKSIKVYDVQGRLIAEQNNVKANTASISNLKANNQVLIVRVTGEDNSEVNKKVMN
ncbi:T9SS sorting signal type C domain-containing protein [Flavobacterium franklandianum]|uniref:T9SS sorting signal type C domain-containing protein n=1 Tax=Flavobacterium franklandianum TaxID=2594430 RepID=UPI001179FDBB|nr:T9SS sorting signal type C domain-containing protein [Flavobacterium franklandianum]TRX23303.1 T9SS sorting signal type C domain-containing protein [Flavobacterium franklandianum]